MRRASAAIVASLLLLVTGCGGSGGGGTPPPPTGVCGEITSRPKVCNFTWTPNPVRTGQSSTWSVGVSDLEGDITQVCIGIMDNATGEFAFTCVEGSPRGTTINETLSDSLSIDLAPGSYTWAMSAQDAAGQNTEPPATVVLEVTP